MTYIDDKLATIEAGREARVRNGKKCDALALELDSQYGPDGYECSRGRGGWHFRLTENGLAILEQDRRDLAEAEQRDCLPEWRAAR